MPTEISTRRFSRRRFLQFFAAAAFTAGGTAGYGRVIEPRWVDLTELSLPVPGLPPALDGARFVQLSDIHLGRYFSSERLAHAISLVRGLDPRWVVLTGDYVGHTAESAAGLIDPLRLLEVPIYAIYGNHDYWTHRPTVERHLNDAGATVLLNQATAVEDGLWIAGVDDIWSGRPDLKATLRDVPAGATTVLLAHEPDFFDQVVAQEAPITLQLSGHSHGGQVRIPRAGPDEAGYYSWAPVLPNYGRRYPIGLRTNGERRVYTNRGLGVWPIPFRFNCRPEITAVILRAA